jgi:hypothetical protein
MIVGAYRPHRFGVRWAAPNVGQRIESAAQVVNAQAGVDVQGQLRIAMPGELLRHLDRCPALDQSGDVRCPQRVEVHHMRPLASRMARESLSRRLRRSAGQNVSRIHLARARLRSQRSIAAAFSFQRPGQSGSWASRPASHLRSNSARSARIGCRSSRRCFDDPALSNTPGESPSRRKLAGVRLRSSEARKPVPTATL